MSDDDFSSLPRSKTQTFTIKERKLILKLVNKHYDIVHNKKVDSRSTNQKNQAWEAINQEFLLHKNIARLQRTPQQLKRCWENLRSKAKKGDVISQKLLQWGENKHALSQKNGGDFQNGNSGDDISDPLLDEDSSTSLEDKEGEFRDGVDSAEASLQEELQQLSQLSSITNSQNCQHCQCDKLERTVRTDLLKLEKRQKDLIHRLTVQNLRTKAKHERELHRLALHELSLRVENERRRADILEKELSNYI